MTQKELLYLEDAIGHETNIIKILEESIKNLNDQKLVSFLEQEKEKHSHLKNELLNMMEVKSNEW